MTYGIIYKATGPTGKVYVGQTVKTLKARKSAHAFRAKKQDRRDAFQIALLDEGFDSFTWEQIDTADTAEELDRKEKAWIARYDSMNPDKGYNGNDGGHNASLSEEARRKTSKTLMGHPVSEEARRKMSEALEGEKHPNFGKHLSGETRQKISEAHMGKKHGPMPEEQKKKLSEAQKGRKHPPITEDTRRKMSEAHMGKHQTPESRHKISETLKIIKGRRG